MTLPIPPELLTGQKLTFSDVQRIVIEHGFGTVPFDHHGHDCFMTHGINYAMLSKAIPQEEVIDALDRFFRNDFGNMYDWDESPTPGREYGCYPSAYGKEPSDGSIMVHRQFWQGKERVTVYFQFER